MDRREEWDTVSRRRLVLKDKYHCSDKVKEREKKSSDGGFCLPFCISLLIEEFFNENNNK